MNAPPPVTPPPSGNVRASRVVLLVVGSIVTLVAIGLLAAGGVLGWAHAFERDSDGYLTTHAQRLQTPTYALTSGKIDLGTDPVDEHFDVGDLATVRIRATAADGAPVFVGIGRQRDVDRYLQRVAHDEIVDADVSGNDPRDFRVLYRRIGGTVTPAPPGDQTFWDASATGAGTQTVTWDLRSGNWSVVVMNANAAPGVAVDASIGAKADWLLPLAIALLVGGAILLTGGILMIVFGANGLRGPPGAPPEQPADVAEIPAEDDEGGYPLRLDGHLDKDLSRWMWVVKWFLAIPHYIVLAFLWLAFGILTVIAFFAILFTGRYPRGIFDFNVGVLRWMWRVSFYSFSVLGTDRYPPFTLEDAPDYPARLHVEYPGELSRGLVLVKWWLLAIPHYIVVSLLGGGLLATAHWSQGHDHHPWSAGWSGPGGGLIGILVAVAAVVLLFAGCYPKDIFRLVIGLNRWVFRVAAYATLMTDEYPPFRLDQGGRDPGTPRRPRAESADPPAEVVDPPESDEPPKSW